MTLPATIPFILHTGDGSTVSFPYPWLLLDTQDLQVYLGEVVTTAYNVTGLGVVTGGTIIFYVPPALGTRLLFVRVMPTTQPVDLPLGTVLPSATLENAYDRVTMLVQDIHEILTRIPQLKKTTASLLRNLVFPAPAAGSPLIGWNATLDALTLYALSFTVPTILPGPGEVHGGTAFTLAASTFAGTGEMRAAAAGPANSKIKGVTIKVDTTFGTSNGLTGLWVGDDVLIDRWSRVVVARTAGTETGEGNFSGAPEVQCSSALDIVVRSDGGLFDAVGLLHGRVHWRMLQTDNS